MAHDDFEEQLLARRTTMSLIAAGGSMLLAAGFIVATVFSALFLPFEGIAYVVCVVITAVCALAALAGGVNSVREARALMAGDLEGANKLVLDGIEKARRQGDAYIGMVEGMEREDEIRSNDRG